MGRCKRRRLILLGIALMSYVGIYLVLTILGAYRVDMTGRRRNFGGLAIMDAEYWQPRGMYFRMFTNVSGRTAPDGDLLGWLFAPMILLDRAVWHHDHVMPFENQSIGDQPLEPSHPTTAASAPSS